MQRARCYLIGETAVVLELEPPVTLASQKRIWRLAQRLVDMPNVVEAIPGMNNITVILRNPESLALDAIERLQRWWEESEALEPESRFIEIPVVYGGAGGPDLAVVAAHCGLSENRLLNCTPPWNTWSGFRFSTGLPVSREFAGTTTRHGALNRAYSFRQVLSGSAGRRLVFIRWQRRVAGS